MRALTLVVLAALWSTVASTASAAEATLQLVPASVLSSVTDSDGRWEFDGGKVYLGPSEIARFVRKKRFSSGVAPLNSAALEITVIWNFGDYNFTLKGIHNFTTNRVNGGVSGTDVGCEFLESATFSGDSNLITITY